jgi:hypothetical protein
LIPIQHVHQRPWSPNAALGTQYGQAAHDNALQLGIPPGVNIWCDLEGIAQGTSHQSIIDYCNAWYQAVADGGEGYIPGIYIGDHVFLTAEQLYWALPFKHYWSSPNATPVAQRGYQLLQLSPLDREIAGVQVDVDVTQCDLKGDSVQWLAPATNPNV